MRQRRSWRKGQRVRCLLRFEALQEEVNINSADDDDGVSQAVSQLLPQLLLSSTLGRLRPAVIRRDVDHYLRDDALAQVFVLEPGSCPLVVCYLGTFSGRWDRVISEAVGE